MAEKDIQTLLDTQHRLEKSLMEKIQAFDDSLKQAVAAANKDTVAKLRLDFSSFKEIVFGVLDMLRTQVSSLHNSMEAMEQRQRRKCLIFNGVAEEGNKENTQALVLNIINNQLELKTLPDGKKCIIRSLDELDALIMKFPSPQSGARASGGTRL
ncbi:hypothetical protein NE865_15028 [Phthorimaea operculella]|nr:hypothetical protein NE865_15028 [Phthorimaea operculella]